MPHRVLCDEGLRVSLDGAGDITKVIVSDGRRSIVFQTPTVAIEAVLIGEPIQISGPEGYCRVEPEEETIFLEFSLTGYGRKTCRFPHRRLADVLNVIRAQM